MLVNILYMEHMGCSQYSKIPKHTVYIYIYLYIYIHTYTYNYPLINHFINICHHWSTCFPDVNSTCQCQAELNTRDAELAQRRVEAELVSARMEGGSKPWEIEGFHWFHWFLPWISLIVHWIHWFPWFQQVQHRTNRMNSLPQMLCHGTPSATNHRQVGDP